jgi:hypothetical protein
MRHLFYLFTLLFLFGCNQTSKKNNATVKQDTLKNVIATTDSYPKMKVYTKEEQEIGQKEFEEEAKSDSIRLGKALMNALNYANLNKNKSTFKFEMNSDDTSFNVTTQLVYGNLFSQNIKHLLVRRLGPSSVICNIFLLKNEKFKLVAEHVQEGLTYLDDTLKDVNGDSYKDYLVHWYPSSGCCRRNVYSVFLYLPETGQFTNDYQFINPTFYPFEKVIRGVGYGYMASLYKYKWNGLKVDTLEFVYLDTSTVNKFYITKKSDYNRPPLVKSKIVNKIPEEYEKIESLDWFLNN